MQFALRARTRRNGAAFGVHAENAVTSAAVLVHAGGPNTAVGLALFHEPLHVLHARDRNDSELGDVRATLGVRLHFQLCAVATDEQIHQSFVVNL